ncbi:EP300-interacting inhibitor of differentiation 1-like [Molossus nigricans]
MSEMHEVQLSGLCEDNSDESDLLQMEGGSGKQEPSPKHSCSWTLPQPQAEGPVEEEGVQPMVEPEGDQGLANQPTLREQPGLITGPDLKIKEQGEEFDDWEDNYSCLEEEQLSGACYIVSAALEEVNRMFLRPFRAGEAALSGSFQMHYEMTLFDQLAFIEELVSLMVVSCLTEELGCDEIIARQ